VAAGAPVVIMGDPTRLWVKVYIPEDLISQVTVDQQARIRVDGLDKDVPGRVRYIATSAEFTPRNIQTPEERATQTFAVKVSPDNTQISLYPGVAADVYFEQGKVDE
ncbi:MAG: HlyD family secretion protein, partial [Candidatus Omnitrophica bacterium]|nr:HlyD family secretion protein [Candidatus Omnitrophota bacterium]